nr:uncharacterized protein LOC126534754 [Dermacentor andersoni]
MIIDKYLPVADSSAPTQFPDYAGCAVPELGQDFTAGEIRDALFSLNHALLNRLKEHAETNEMYTHNMIGFRAGLSTRVAKKLIKHQIIDRITGDTRGILGPDLHNAFDNISHEFILQCIAGLGLGKKAYDFVRSFLSQRTAKLKIEGYLSQEIPLGSRVTPQGSVISPTLFNIALIGLSKELAKIQ